MELNLGPNKKVLIISSCCFSKSESNGKVLESLFGTFQKDQIAQFFIRNDEPDWGFCDNYFRVTDKDIIKCLTSKSGGHLIKSNSSNGSQLSGGSVHSNTSGANERKVKKDAFILFLRNLAWKFSPWEKRTKFLLWLKDFNPDVIFVLVGENPFLLDLARKTAAILQKKLVVYSSEAYYLKDYNYFVPSSEAGKLFYPLFHRIYKQSYKKLMRETDSVLYICPKLMDDFNKLFPINSAVLYPSSTINLEVYDSSNSSSKLRISYLGNLGLDRHKSIIEIGKALQELEPSQSIEVFGGCSNLIKEELEKAPGVNYHGVVPFEQVVKEIDKSDILVHVEGFNPFYVEDTKYGFSTKIADSLMSGRCFFIYAPASVACYEYVHSFNPHCTASTYEDMRNKLNTLISDWKIRKEAAAKGKQVAMNNHTPSSCNAVLLKALNQ